MQVKIYYSSPDVNLNSAVNASDRKKAALIFISNKALASSASREQLNTYAQGIEESKISFTTLTVHDTQAIQ